MSFVAGVGKGTSPTVFRDLGFEEDISTFYYKNEHLEGEGGGVFVLYSPGGKKFTLKAGNGEHRMKEEILHDMIYRGYGCSVPPFTILKSLPEKLAQSLGLPRTGVFRLSTFIEEDPVWEGKIAEVKEQIGAWFVLDAFLGNVDIFAEHSNNVKLDKAGVLWRVDNGSTIRFRARGKTKAASSRVTELDTMKDPTLSPLGSTVYSTLSELKLKEQAERLVEKSTVIFDCVEELDKLLYFENKQELLEIYFDRLDDLKIRFQLGFPLFSGRFEKAQEERTSAGVFVTCRHDGRDFAFLGQRRGHVWWGNPGGKSDPQDKLLADTASREVLEETDGNLLFTPYELLSLPYVDLSSSDHKYRMYFATADYKEVVLSDEYTDSCWLPLDSIYGAMDSSVREPLEGVDVVVVRATDAMGKERIVPIHPPLYSILCEQRRKKQSLKPVAMREHPAAIRKSVAETVIRYASGVQEVLLRKESEPALQATGEAQSDIYLKVWLGEQFKEGDTRANVTLFLSEDEGGVDPHHKEVFIEAMEEEKKHPMSMPGYHATDGPTACSMDIATKIRKQLYILSEQNPVFRLFDEHFTFANVQQMLEHFRQTKGFIDNNDPSYQRVGLSANLFLLKSHYSFEAGASTSQIFMRNESNLPPQFGLIIRFFIQTLGISDAAVEMALRFYKKYQHFNKGRLYQLFFKKDIVDHLCYPAVIGGEINPLEIQGRKIDSLSEILPILKENPALHAQYIESLQARIYLLPQYMHDQEKVKMKVYYGAKEFPHQAYERDLTRLVNQMLFEFLTTSKALLPKTFAVRPAILEHYSRFCRELGVEDRKEQDPASLMGRYIQRGDFHTARQLVEQLPDLNLLELPNPDFMSSGALPTIDAVSLAAQSRQVSQESIGFCYELLKKKFPKASLLLEKKGEDEQKNFRYVSILCQLAILPEQECEECAILMLDLFLELKVQGIVNDSSLDALEEILKTKKERKAVCERSLALYRGEFHTFTFADLLRAVRRTTPEMVENHVFFCENLFSIILARCGYGMNKEDFHAALILLRMAPAMSVEESQLESKEIVELLGIVSEQFPDFPLDSTNFCLREVVKEKRHYVVRTALNLCTGKWKEWPLETILFPFSFPPARMQKVPLDYEEIEKSFPEWLFTSLVAHGTPSEVKKLVDTTSINWHKLPRRRYFLGLEEEKYITIAEMKERLPQMRNEPVLSELKAIFDEISFH